VDDMLRAAVIGYEASYTMAVSIQPKHKALGFHATGTCGMFGATLAAAYMLGFSDEDRFEAFAAACVAASGFLKVLDEGSELKPYNVAKTALLSLTSLQMAKAGFKGCSDPLGGYRGYLRMMTGDERTKLKSTLLNGTYAIMKSYIKPYASCRYTHSPVEAAIHLHNKYGLLPEMIEKITVKTYNLAVAGHDHTDIQGSYSAKMSTPYSTAVALVYGKAGLQEFDSQVLDNTTIQELTSKVHVFADEELSKIFPDKQCAIVTISTTKGDYKERVDFPKGEPENPLSEEEFESRYADLMSYGGVNENVYKNIYKQIKNQNSKVNDLIANL
jgi:2-methylcitrate dehydratase PrpD